MKPALIVISLVTLLLMLTLVAAEDVPSFCWETEDNQCRPGKHCDYKGIYSVGACIQTHCPPGASRLYSKSCSCWTSEWGGEPKETCVDENGLVVFCLPEGGDCLKYVSSFDPTTGMCKDGTEPDPESGCPLQDFDDAVGLKPDLPGEPCDFSERDFEDNWREFSHIDKDISLSELPLEERSWEAQQYINTKQALYNAMVDKFFLDYEFHADREARVELIKSIDALKRGRMSNLLKAFIRLAYITFDTAYGTPGLGKGARGIAGSYRKLFDADLSKVQKVAAALKVAKALTPGDSIYAINQSKMRGKLQDSIISFDLDMLESLGDPKDVGKGVAQDIIKKALVPDAKLSEEEIGILKKELQESKRLDDALQKSYNQMWRQRRALGELNDEISQLESELNAWEEQEKARVRGGFERDCGW